MEYRYIITSNENEMYSPWCLTITKVSEDEPETKPLMVKNYGCLSDILAEIMRNETYKNLKLGV